MFRYCAGRCCFLCRKRRGRVGHLCCRGFSTYSDVVLATLEFYISVTKTPICKYLYIFKAALFNIFILTEGENYCLLCVWGRYSMESSPALISCHSRKLFTQLYATLSSIKQQTDKGSDLFVITVEQIEGEVTDIFLESWWRPKQRGFLSFIWPDPAEVWQERGAWYAANGHRSGLSFVHGAHTSHTYWANWRPTKAELNGEWILGLTSDLCVAC